MNQATHWWLQNTAAGRRTLERMMPNSAIPLPTRRQMCRERGHEESPGRNDCLRCGEEIK